LFAGAALVYSLRVLFNALVFQVPHTVMRFFDHLELILNHSLNIFWQIAFESFFIGLYGGVFTALALCDDDLGLASGRD
jgi:hypothetical protein